MPDSTSLDAYIAAAARVLELPIDPAWQPSVRANLELTLRLAAVVAAFPLPDEADAAPVFEA
jgi:1-carboxybiuret hydrolase subunit AtzG-like protein